MAAETSEGPPRRTLLRLGLGVFFAMNVMVFSMALWSRDVYANELQSPGPLANAVYEVFRYLALLFCLPVLFLLGEPLAVGVWQTLGRGLITTDLLLLIGVAAAVAYSLCSVVSGTGAIYFDVASMILLFLTLGRWFEAQGKLRSGRALDELSKLLPEQVHVVRDCVTTDVPRESVGVGDTIRVFPGERFSVDGVITSGSGDVDEQVVSGESHPTVRRPGDAVHSGTLNIDGDLQIEVTAAAGEETVSRMLDLVRKARRARGRYERLADRVTVWFVPAVALVALAAAWSHGHREGMDEGLLVALSVALIACPCALGLATPMAVWMALGRAAHGQVLFRNGQALETLAKVRAMILDKTGTLTTGDTVVSAFVANDESEREYVVAVAGQLASASNHFLSTAIRNYVDGRTASVDIAEVKTLPGKGLQGRLCGRSNSSRTDCRILLGSPQWLRREGLEFAPQLSSAVEEVDGGEAPVTAVGWDGVIRGVFLFRERLREDVNSTLDDLRNRGMHVAVATGDRTARAVRLAGQLNIPVLAEQLPEDKVNALNDLRGRCGSCAMVGDGINDAPALASSDVGIAMGCGADLSRDSAAVCLLSNDLSRLPWTVDLARQTVRVIRQNLWWALGYNAIGIALAVSGRLNPVFAAAAMVASSAFVITNSLRLGRFPEPDAWVGSPHLEEGASMRTMGARDKRTQRTGRVLDVVGTSAGASPTTSP